MFNTQLLIERVKSKRIRAGFLLRNLESTTYGPATVNLFAQEMLSQALYLEEVVNDLSIPTNKEIAMEMVTQGLLEDIVLCNDI